MRSYPLDLSYSEFIAGYFSILDGLLQSGDQVQARQLHRYLKFLYPTYFAIREQVGQGEVAYNNHSCLDDL